MDRVASRTPPVAMTAVALDERRLHLHPVGSGQSNAAEPSRAYVNVLNAWAQVKKGRARTSPSRLSDAMDWVPVVGNSSRPGR
jgi:hypothetical protein